VLRTTLDNGLKVVIVRDAFAPVATQQVTYFVGASQAPKGFPGIAHAQEHMMFRGSPGLTKDQLSGIYARMGGDMNAFTTNDITSYFFTVPAQDIDVALHVGALRMAGVDDSEVQWQKERGAIEQEVARDHSMPVYALYSKLLKHMFAGTSYAHDALGTKPSFDKLTGKQLKNFHTTWYAPNNAMLVVTGDVNPQRVLGKVKKLYGSLHKRKLPAKSKMTFAPVEATTFSTESDQPYGIVVVAFRMPGYKSPDYPAAELAADALASKRGPIQALKYEGKALAATFQMQTMPDAGVGLALAVYPPGGDADSVRQALVKAVKSVHENGIKPELLKAAKRRAVLDHALQNNSVFGLAMTWTNAIALAGLDSPEQALARLKQVTPKQVNAQIETHLDLSHAVTLIAEPTPGTKPTAGKGFGGKESFGSAPKGKVHLPAWAKKAFAKLPQPKPFLKPVDTTLDNGLRLIVQPLHTSHSVSVYGAVDQNEDLQAPKGQAGVGSVLSSLFSYGPRGMSRLDYAAAQDKLGAEMSVGPSFSLKVLPKYFGDGVKLLARDLLHPALPKKAFKKQQFILARQAAGQRQSPQFKFKRAVQKTLVPEGDPSLRLESFKSIGSLTHDDLEAYYDKVYRPDVTTIVVVGDITPAKAKAAVKKYFGEWKAEGAKPDLDYRPIPLSKKSHTFVHDPVKKQDQVVLAETLNVNYTNPDHFALDLVNSYLSGGFYATPLYRVLREEMGLVYNVGSSFDFERNRGTFSVHYGSYPDKVDRARDAAIKVLRDTMAKPLTNGELHLAKSIGLRKIQLSNQSVGSIAKGWISRSEDNLPLDWNYVMAKHYEKLTAPEIQHVLKKYVDPDRLSTIVLGQPTDGK
jgi:zinc protease